jgi:dihydroorotate dehydrogenase (NAD+) catalytic subunit
MNLGVALGPVSLRSPLVAASGTVGSVVDAAGAIDFAHYGAAVAKSVAGTPWPGRPAPRLAPTEAGMLNGIGIQNPGVEAWAAEVGTSIADLGVPVWGSAVGHTVEEFGEVAAGLAAAGVSAVEVNLSCPNLDHGEIWAHDADLTRRVVTEVRAATTLPIGAKLSPNVPDVTPMAAAALEAGADWLVLTNTALGAGIDPETRTARLSGVVGGYSGPGLKPISLRCVLQARRSLGPVPIVGTGGIRTGEDVLEYLMAGASAVGVGTGHFEDPKLAARLLREVTRWCDRHGVSDLGELVGSAVQP